MLRFVSTLIVLIASAVAHSECINELEWRVQPGGGLVIDIAAGPDGSLWGVGGDFQTYKYQNGSWNSIGGGALRVAVSPEGRPWVVNDAYVVYYHDGSQFIPLPGNAQSVAAGAKGNLWGIGLNLLEGGYEVTQWNGREWKGMGRGARRIAVGPDGEPVIVDDTRKIYRRQANGEWKLLPGTANDIAVGPVGELWAVGTRPVPGGFNVMRWNGKAWQDVGGAAIKIAVGANNVPYTMNYINRVQYGERCRH